MTIVLKSFTSGLTKPSVLNGDVLIALVGGSSDAVITSPTGWKLESRVLNTNGIPQLCAFSRAVDGTEPSTFVFGFTGVTNPVSYMLAFSGVDNNYPIDLQTTWTQYNETYDATWSGTSRIANDFVIAANIHWVPVPTQTPVLLDATDTDLGATSNQTYFMDVRSSGLQALGFLQYYHWAWDTQGQAGAVMVLEVRPSGASLTPAVNIGPDVNIKWKDTYYGYAIVNDAALPYTYSWTIVSAPVGSTATITNSAAQQMSFTPDKLGTYDIRCTVTDANTNTYSDDVILTSRAAIYTRVSGVAKPSRMRSRRSGAVH